jgi:hypothetical protein
MPTSAVATTGAVGAFRGTAASVLSVRNVILNGLTGAVFTQYSIFYDPSHLNCKNGRYNLLHTWILVGKPPFVGDAVRGATIGAAPKGAGFNAPPQ